MSDMRTPAEIERDTALARIATLEGELYNMREFVKATARLNEREAQQLVQERDTALSELAKLAEQLETEHENHKNTMGEFEQTRDELADAKRDAERYRWLCSRYAKGYRALSIGPFTIRESHLS